ncbi:MAG: exodeoxyribonuclease VII large subunit [Rhodovibrionaceae bacterium]
MDDLATNLPEMTVTELSQAVKRTVEGGFERVRVRGEITRPSFPSSGHVYFRLKDESAVLDAVCWRGAANRLSIRPEEGLEVIAVGKLTTYAGRSTYQIVVDSLEVAGEGALLKLLEDRKKKLAAEGLFDQDRKRPLPFLPEVIGVITSPSGAVIRDILHRLAERFPRHVLVWPVAVQGDGAAEQVARAIEGFNALPEGGEIPRPDVLIVARGGGSLEDLWAFNEEVVARAAAGSAIPLISAVGHETDTTLIDFVSDRRAPTPTAAAEIAVPVRSELLTQVLDLGRRAVAGGNRLLQERRVRVESLGRGLPDPLRLLGELAQRLDDRAERLKGAIRRLIPQRRAELREVAAALPQPRQQLRWAEGDLRDSLARLESAGRRLLPRHAESLRQLDSETRLRRALRQRLDGAAESLAALRRLLETTSIDGALKRGFAVVHGPSGVLTRAAALDPGMELRLQFQDGEVPALASGGAGGAAPKAKAPSKPKPVSGDDDQGSLL